jgi:uncharacterized protein
MAPAVFVSACELGLGLFAARDFQAGETIMRLRGPRFDREDPIHLCPQGANLLQTGSRTYILLDPPGVYANHSCNPNAGIMGNRRLIAIRGIARGDEIRFDYSTTMDEEFWTMPCSCGDALCRGVIGDFKNLPPETRDIYLALGVVQRFIARKYHGNRGYLS